MLIAGNSKTVALGPGGMALAPGLPLGLGWFIRRRLGLDASDILDRKLGLEVTAGSDVIAVTYGS